MLIAIFDDRVDASVAERFPGHKVMINGDRTLGAAAFRELARGAQVIGVRAIRGWQFDRGLIEALPELEFLHKTGTGLDWLDLPALTEHGILVANNDGFNAASVADHILLLTQLALRDTLDKILQVRNGIWDRSHPSGDIIALEGAIVGIVGLGQIGTRLARRFAAAGASLVATGRHPSQIDWLSDLRWLPLDELLRQSDVVALCVPLTPETEYLISARELAMMKPTAVLINAARGRIVDEAALYDALVQGRLRAAGIDAWEQEPVPPDYPLARLSNVYGTPHVSGHAADQVGGLLDNIDRFVTGRRPLRLINAEIIERGSARARHLSESAPTC